MSFQSMGQVSGNMNYQYRVRIPNSNINVPISRSNQINISVKGLANVKADYYVAVFHMAQSGETAQEVNKLIDEKINHVRAGLKERKDVDFYVDMLSFVPIYEIDAVKKLFSKTTYNEIPKGFEVQKNIHIKYKDANELNKIIALCAEVEIYNLVRVDLFSDSLELIKQKMRSKAKAYVNKQLADKKSLLKVDWDEFDRYSNDGFNVKYPVEMYKSYQAYCNNSIRQKMQSNLKSAPKATTVYYKPIFDKEFDYVINPLVFEPVIQVMYNIKLTLVKKPIVLKKEKPQKVQKEIEVRKEFILISPQGNVKTLKI